LARLDQSRASIMERSRLEWPARGCSFQPRPKVPSAELELAVHQRPVAGERAEEGVVAALLQLGGRELDRGRYTSTDELRRRNDARIILRHVVVGGSGRRACSRDSLKIRSEERRVGKE